MHRIRIRFLPLAILAVLSAISLTAHAAEEQAARAAGNANAGAISGTVTDPTGAVIPKANVTLTNPVSGFSRSTQSDAMGMWTVANVPFNTYRLTVSAVGMTTGTQQVDVRSAIPQTITTVLQVGAATETVNVTAQAGDLIDADPVGHTDVDQDLIAKIPLSGTSSVSSLVTLASPGISADSNGMFHGMGDHASNSFSVDGQPITDQQSKTFSNQIPLDSVQSIEVIPGAPPAE
jgi:hypothetical protein